MATQADLSAALQSAGVTVYGLQVNGNSVVGAVASEEELSKAYSAIAGVDNSMSLNLSVNTGFQTQAANAAAAGSQSYTVQSGDSLSKIAKHFYGDASQWKKIYEANRDTISNPDLIHAGAQLTIPS
jgi:nucleoid-associated protein YgaU